MATRIKPASEAELAAQIDDLARCAADGRSALEGQVGPLSSVSRVRRQQHRGSGWIVRYQVLGRPFARYFSDRRYGTAEAGLAAAAAFAGAQQEQQGELLALHRRLAPRATTRSGVPGVARYEPSLGRGAGWIAYLDDPVTRRRRSKRFAVSVHGELAARLLAMAWRARAVATLQARYEQLCFDLIPREGGTNA